MSWEIGIFRDLLRLCQNLTSAFIVFQVLRGNFLFYNGLLMRETFAIENTYKNNVRITRAIQGNRSSRKKTEFIKKIWRQFRYDGNNVVCF